MFKTHLDIMKGCSQKTERFPCLKFWEVETIHQAKGTGKAEALNREKQQKLECSETEIMNVDLEAR